MEDLSTLGYLYNGDFDILLKAAEKAITQMKLILKDTIRSPNMCEYQAQDKIGLFSGTGWKYDIRCEKRDQAIQLTLAIKPWMGFLGVYADECLVANKKAEEFIGIVKLHAPNNTSLDIERMPCPLCGEMIAKTAKLCRFCKSEIK